MPSNIDDVIDSVDDTKDEMESEMKKVAIRSSGRVKDDAEDNIRQDADWTGRTLMALNTSFEQFSNGQFQSSTYVNRATAPYARVVEMGSGSRSEDEWIGSRAAARPENMPDGYPYSAPSYSQDLVENIIDWVETKPIVSEEGPIELGREIAGIIANKGTFAHPFMRPAWQENVELIKSDFERAIRRL